MLKKVALEIEMYNYILPPDRILVAIFDDSV